MGLFDSINPFKKKDDLGLPPLDQDPNLAMKSGNESHDLGIGQQPLPTTPAMPATPSAPSMGQQQPMDDHRMNMPLGDSLRQERIGAMHGSSDIHEIKQQHNPMQKELELISSKLDYLRASLEAINHRLETLEHLTKQELENKKW